SQVLKGDYSSVRWRRLGLGVWHVPLVLSSPDSGDLRLFKVAPGLAMPDHGHSGSELSLILSGSYTDKVGTFVAG
ncbi:cupin domain-containing protein, partial [Vibrio parahaemolyticus]